MLSFLKGLGRGPIRYLVNTHWHGDHANGNFLFEGVQMVCHELCVKSLGELGAAVLQESKEGVPEFEEVEIVTPDITFDRGDMFLHVGGKSMQIILTPGHTPDSLVVYVKEDKVLLASDTVMPVPYFVWGNRDDFVNSLQSLLELNLECVVQGHGEVLLRGEIHDSINRSIRYLNLVKERVTAHIAAGRGPESLDRIDIESCGKSRIPLNGLVQDLHRTNVQALYQEMIGSAEQSS
jgi:glyoxylase-like metal-dependent hydrolase (beta-lactamase superfamily II)